MDIALWIGFGLVIVFLIAVAVEVWKDTNREKKFWKERENNRMKE